MAGGGQSDRGAMQPSQRVQYMYAARVGWTVASIQSLTKQSHPLLNRPFDRLRTTSRRYDFAAVVLNAACLLYTSPADASRGLLLRFGGSFLLWLLTWSDRALRGIPYNPVQSLLHVVGVSAHMHVAYA